MAETRDFAIVGDREAAFVNEVAPPRDFAIPGVGMLNSTAEAAAGGGLSIPIAAYHYNHNVGSNL